MKGVKGYQLRRPHAREGEPANPSHPSLGSPSRAQSAFITASSAQDVTPERAPDQQERAAGPRVNDETLQAVTAALDRLAYWAQRTGGPSAAAEKATIIAVGVYGFTLTTNATRVRFVDSEGRAHSVARVLFMHRYDQVKAGRCDACGEPIPFTAYRRQRRGARSDRRYCSNPCRQRAYRERSRTI